MTTDATIKTTTKTPYGKELNKEILSRFNVLVTICEENVNGFGAHIKTLQDRKMTFALILNKKNRAFIARESIKGDPEEIIGKKPLMGGTVLKFYLGGELV